MILITLLTLLLLVLVTVTVFLISIGGTVFIYVFGDVIVCIAIIALLIGHLIKKRKEKEIIKKD